MTIFGIKSCDTCRKAVKALGGATFVDVRTDGLSDAVLDRALDAFGAKLVNTRSTTWRALSPSERERPSRDLLKENPTLMKRPLIEHEGALYLGWGPDTRAQFGL